MLPLQALLDRIERDPALEHLTVWPEELFVHLQVCRAQTKASAVGVDHIADDW
jgi:hypothetical protein